MQATRPKYRALLIALMSAAAFMLGGDYAAERLIDTQKTRQLQELAQVALRRLENSIEYGRLALDETAGRGLANCEPATLQSIRLHVYQRSAVKDIRVLNREGAIQCSAYSETLEFDHSWPMREETLVSREASVRLFRVEQLFGVALGVARDVSPETSLAAIIGVNSALFDVLPAALRDKSEVLLELTNGAQISRSSATAALDESSGGVRVEAASAHFPARATIRVANEAFAAWNREPYLPILLIAGLVGLAFGVLLARLWSRSPDPGAVIDEAIVAGEFRPFLQPVFNLNSGEVVGCEILARWIKQDGSMIAPGRFIPQVEECGRIEILTWHLLSAALDDLRDTLERNPRFKVSLNIAPQHFLSERFVDDLHHVVTQARVSPRNIVLEVTEREELTDLARAACIVDDLRNFGYRVALDDVGIGHSGLSYIQSLGAHVLKIDKFFVDSVCRDASAIAIVGMLVRLAAELGMDVVAEGIEDMTQLAALAGCGICEGQGYLVAPPMPAKDFAAFLLRPPGPAFTQEAPLLAVA